MSHAFPSTELLAPAGDWECLRAAAANGADAVYFGLSNFNARHRATNFTVEELPDAMRFLHDRNVRGYVTFNTLIFPEELADAARLVERISAAGADAVIVQDLGLARLIRRLAPELPIHASTQMTLTEPRGVEIAREVGVERVILARELALADIETIVSATNIPVEVFVHGALCVAYSGQCLTSEALGGRSANRGQCAQACRLPYDLLVDGQRRDLGDYAYLLSPQDLAAHEQVADLVRLGVASLKIEGRLKSAQYVAATTAAYRAALDAATAGRDFSLPRQERLDLAQSFSRGFSTGFLKGVDHQSLVHGRFPKNRGVHVGLVRDRTEYGVVVELDAEHATDVLKPGDGLVFDEGRPDQDEQGGRLASVRAVAGANAAATTRVAIEFATGDVNPAAISLGCQVWRTDDPDFRRRMERTYSRVTPAKRTQLVFRVVAPIGGELRVTVSDDAGASAEVRWPGPLQAALRHPLDETLLTEQFGRLGETPFALARVELDAPEAVMVPKSVLNDLRRQATGRLLELRRHTTAQRRIDPAALATLQAETREPLPAEPIAAHGAVEGAPQLYVLARTREQLEAVCAWHPPAGLPGPALVWLDFEDVRRYSEAVAFADSAGLPVGVATLRILKPGEEGLLRIVGRAGARAVLVRNLAAWRLFREEWPALPLTGDYSLNVANELTAEWLFRGGLRRLTPSYDLNWEQFQTLVAASRPERFETVIHQHIPMFHMEHCVFAATLSEGKDWRDCGRPCDRHRVELRDRTGAEFPLLADTGCRNTVFNVAPQSAAEYVGRMLALGLRHFRVELMRERREQVGPLLDRYVRVLGGLDDGPSAWRGLRVLQQLGVTRGTLRSMGNSLT